MPISDPRSAALPPIRESSALFLDFDGTLAELAPSPDAVRTAPGLVESLASLSASLGGALAIVSGRPVADLDRFLAPLRLALAAEHGAVLRWADGRMHCAAPPDLRDAVQAADKLSRAHPGVILEHKSMSVALHYRGAPQLEQTCIDALAATVERRPDLELLRGKCVVEVRRAGVDKGRAIAALMASEPFRGRLPIFAGDDVTDEAGFAVVQEAGGVAIKVGDGSTLARHACASPEALRDWLASAASGADSARSGAANRIPMKEGPTP
ncbi:MAG: trehalose-phosphatase [Burkholderiaceae bacterium]|jgi:trehalose 6-phosphate phosphatase|nr:trehalose-phosphatase [Burkholderiaceae bacterium]